MHFYSLPILYHHFSVHDICIQYENVKPKKQNKSINESLQYHLSTLLQYTKQYTTLWNFYASNHSIYAFLQGDEITNYKLHFKNLVYMKDKMYLLFIDIYYALDLFSYIDNKPKKIMNIGETKGGFMYALEHVKCVQHDICTIVSSKDMELEMSSFSFRKEIGDFFSVEAFHRYIHAYKNSQDIIIMNEVYEPSKYNAQLFHSICFAICCQKYNGIFICRINDIYDSCTVEILYILSLFYYQVHMYKPKILERHLNVKFIICTSFLYHNSEFIFDTFLNNIKRCTENYSISGVLHRNIPKHFIDEIITVNAIYGQQQMEYINNTLQWIDTIESENQTHNKITSKQYIKWLKEHDLIS